MQPCDRSISRDTNKPDETNEAAYCRSGTPIQYALEAIVEFAAKNRLPAMYGTPEAVNIGGLMSYAPQLYYQYRRVAAYVDKILKGAKPGDLPVEQPTKFEFVINLT